jgi:hypothetical protein
MLLAAVNVDIDVRTPARGPTATVSLTSRGIDD